LSTLLPTIRLQDTRQCTSAQQINQLEGLAVARSWGFESPLPHQVQIQTVTAEFKWLGELRPCRGDAYARIPVYGCHVPAYAVGTNTKLSAVSCQP
jgi:hypothetical protein